jgi:hypothetical protein
MVAALTAPDKRPALLFEGTFTSGTVHLWTGLYTLAWNSQSWTGLGNLIGISSVDESSDIKGQSCTVSLSGVDTSLRARIQDELRSGAPCIVRLLLFDTGGNVIADPKVAFRGRLDTGSIDETNPERPVLSVVFEHELSRLETPNEWRYTDAHQQSLHPGDTGLSRIAELQDKVFTWPN